MASVRVGVLRGGPSSEYDVSLKTGQAVLKHLPENKYQSVDILITKDGTWHIAGLPVTPAQAAAQVDVFFNCLHGEYGEDGTVQKILDGLLMPYTGSGAFASALGMQKHQAKEYFKREGIKLPRHVLVCFGDDVTARAKEVFNTMAPPWIVKPADRGSSVGVFKVKLLQDLPGAIEKAFDASPNILVEEFVRGVEATCAVVEGLKGEALRALPPIEIRPPANKDLFDYEAKYICDDTREICPGNFAPDEMLKLKELAKAAHRALGLRHYSRSDFIVSPTRGIYLLETNTLPGMTTASLTPKALAVEGVSYPEFLDHIISLALGQK